ncbi:phospholipase A2 inhibitor-like [Harmonia axyridis]|uniref:phospholipase A2 inhibitor-like n=1 Tax=Harmonia axyridis TaxID=115357 RepID=UPI001E279564|nr:phospholipase A2 inhibitor-like [Harmonia axyridis]
MCAMLSIYNYCNQLYFITSVLVILLQISLCENCNNFYNISLMLTTRINNGPPHVFEIPSYTGCNVPKEYINTTEEIIVLDQEIKTIGTRSIYGIDKLKKLLFFGCDIITVSPGAFQDNPNLRILHIKNGNLKTINAGVFNIIPSLQQLNFRENEINMISDLAFSNLPSLKELVLANNDLNVINNTWFENSTNIEILDLRNNNLKRVDRVSLSKTPRLKEILLDFNDIEVVEEDAFANFKELKHLGLSHNRLSQIDANIFQNGILAKKVSLNVNLLNYLSVEFLKMLRVDEISLNGNPWNCLCLNRIHDWLNGVNGTLITDELCSRYDIPHCVYPEEPSSHCVERVDEDLTDDYIKTLKALVPNVDDSCARLD